MRNKISNIGAITGLMIVMCSYIAFSLGLVISGEKLNILYALSNHIGISVLASVFYFNSTSKILSVISAYTAIFFFIASAAFVYVGLMQDESYFQYKICLLVSIPLTVFYESISYFIRKWKARP